MSELNSKVGNNDIKPWMTELWAWADKFKIPDEVLPRNHANLLALTDLSIDCSQLTNLPESIGYLYSLTNLTLNCEALEHLPESVGQFSQLEELIVISETIEQLPDSLANLTQLRGLDIPAHLVDQLPIGIIERYRNNELWIKNIAFTKLYAPQMSEYDLSRYGFFLISDNWDEKSLIDLRFKTAPEFLLGLQTTEKTIKQFDVVDGIIICQLDEVQNVMNLFETTFNEFMGNDPTDIKKALSFSKPAKFIQASTLEMSKSDQVLSQIIDQIPKDITIKDMMFKTESNRHFTFDEFKVISDTIDNMGVEDEHIFYSTEVVDKPKYCWMGMIYMVL
ncbi:leucine-rich repeat domain-containing protein [Psychrobacter sp. CLB018]|uniref:leucine-rich repeat domain-containing protein n=1 Tax=Psychrobacter sp. CLB018 TaxID=3240930 RepID=UPI00351621A3